MLWRVSWGGIEKIAIGGTDGSLSLWSVKEAFDKLREKRQRIVAGGESGKGKEKEGAESGEGEDQIVMAGKFTFDLFFAHAELRLC
jgi:hypothetical protein